MWEPWMQLSRVKNGSPLMLNRKERLKNTFLLEGEYHNLFHLYPVVAFSKLHMQGYEFLASFLSTGDLRVVLSRMVNIGTLKFFLYSFICVFL